MDKHITPSLWRRATDCPVLHPEASKDCILPDSYPDIHKILYTAATVSPGRTLLTAGKIQTDGTLYTCVLFADEEGKLHGVRFAIEYNGQMPYSVEAEDTLLTADTVMEGITARAVNPRKLAIRGKITVTPCLLCKCADEPQLAPELSGVKLEKKLQSVTCRQILSWGEGGIEASEDLALGQEPPIAEIVWSDLQIELTSCEAGDGEVRFGGSGTLHLFYLTPDQRVQYTSLSFPIRSSLQGDAAEGDLCRVVLTPEEVTVMPAEDAAGEARSVELDFTYSVLVTIARKVSSTRPVDCYSVEKPTFAQSETVDLWEDVVDYSREFNRNLEGDASGMKAVIAAFARVNVDSRELSEEGVTLHCAIQATVIGTDEDGNFISLQLAENYPMGLDLMNGAEPCFCRFHWNIPPQGVIDGELVKLRLAGRLSGFGARPVSVTYVGRLSCAEGELPSAGDSITLCYPSPGETLWDIAKRYRIPQSSILSANHITEGDLPTVLLIPH